MPGEETQLQDAAYSDDEFGSEHAYEGGDDAFVDDDKEQDSVKQNNAVGADTEEADQYDGESDDAGLVEPRDLETKGSLVDQMPTDTGELTKAPQEDGETYDGEFNEEDHPPAPDDSSPLDSDEALIKYTPTDAHQDHPPSSAETVLNDDEVYDGEFDNDDPALPTVDNYETTGTLEQTPTTDLKTTHPLDNKEFGNVLVDPDKHMTHDLAESDVSEADYSNDLENDAPVHLALSKKTNSLSRNSTEDNLTQQRSSIPSSDNAELTEDTSRRDGNMSMVPSSDTKVVADPTANDSYTDDQDSDATDDEVAVNTIPNSAKPTTTCSTTNDTTQNERSLLNNDDDYTDEMEDEFPSESNTSKLDGEIDNEVDELNEDGRRETETLLQEARALLELQQNEIDTDKVALPSQDVISSEAVVQPGNNALEIPSRADISEGENNENVAENYVSTYDDTDEFAGDDVGTETPTQETPQQQKVEGQYELDADEFENEEVTAPPDNQQEPIETSNSEKVTSKDHALAQSVGAIEDILPTLEAKSSDESVDEAKDEAEAVPMITEAQPLENSQQVGHSSASTAVKQDKTQASTKSSPKKSPSKSRQLENTKETPQLTGPKQPVNGDPPAPAKQPSPPMKPARPPTKKATPVPSSVLTISSTDEPASTPLSSRSKLKTVKSSLNATTTVSSTTANAHDRTAPNPAVRSPPMKISSRRSPSKAISDLYQNPLQDDVQPPRKEPLPKQKVNSKPSTSGDHAHKRRILQPVRTPANLRFDLPKMEKAKRDWLFVNMFRHGDDLSKYEAFMPPTLLAKPPTAKETKKRPLSARQVYGNPYSSRFESSGRKLVPQPNPELQNRERNWVATTPHDSKLPQYDSILDKYCTRVTSPEVQRQIYQTRQRDLSPQLAFVLEKRVEKHYRKGFYDSFGGVGSYKTEILPTPPGDGMRQRQMSPHSSTKSGLLERQAISRAALHVDED